MRKIRTTLFDCFCLGKNLTTILQSQFNIFLVTLKTHGTQFLDIF